MCINDRNRREKEKEAKQWSSNTEREEATNCDQSWDGTSYYKTFSNHRVFKFKRKTFILIV